MRSKKTRKLRKTRRYRKQQGGRLEDRFPSLSFTLQAPFAEERPVNTAPVKNRIDSWSPDEKKLFHKQHLLTLYETKAGGELVKLCALYFIPSFEGGPYAYLDNLDCYTKTDTFKPISFVIVYKFLQILQEIGIPLVFFSVAAMGSKYYKLFELYHAMGFVCKPSVEDLNVNLGKVLAQLTTQETKNETYFRDLPSRNLANLDTIKELFLRCNEMYGYIPSVLAKIERYFPPLPIPPK